MKKHFVKLASLMALCFVMFSCQKETTVYGTVADYDGDPIGNLQVSLVKTKENVYVPMAVSINGKIVYSTITGSDGQYEIVFTYDNEYPKYWIRLSTNDYYEVNVSKGKANRFDLVW